MIHGDPCRHCGRRITKHGRGLCQRCYYTPGVLAQYPGTHPRSARGVGHTDRHELPAEPTSHPPGSAGKVAVLAERAERGDLLFHPLDYTGKEIGA